MRNLKKILALVLALVMSLSLMATAGASKFPDVDAENPYATAIDVLDGLKVFQGFEDGTFKPTDTLNRAQAAVLVYRIATGDVENKYLDNYTFMQQSKFTDLEGYNWAKGYINYCQNAGIVVGTTATTFDPGAKVTGYQLLVMLLRTLGYGKAGEFADPKGWELQTATIAEREGITKNVTAGDFGAPAPRQMVAEILFRGLLSESVEYSALIPGGYTKTGETLGMREFGLEKISGVVMANEWANLNDGAAGAKVLAAGTTQMVLEDGTTRTLSVATDLDAVGLTYNAYIANGEGGAKKSLTMEKSDINVVAFNEGQAVGPKGKTLYDENRRQGSIPDLADEEGLEITSSTGYYIDYDQGWYKDCTSDYQISYVVNVNMASATLNSPGVSLDEAETKEIITEDEHDDLVALIETAYGKKEADFPANFVFSRSIRIGDAISETDLAIMESIFDLAGRYEANNPVVKGYTIGEVYVGTTQTKDYSDEMSWKAFKAEYLNNSKETVKFDYAQAGESLRVVDNNGDGDAEYVLKVTYTMDQVIGTYKDAPELNEWRVASKYKDNNLYQPDELAVGDVVVWNVIDGKLSLWKAEAVTDTVTTKNFKDVTITTANSADPYGQSGISNKTGMDELIMNMDDKTEYVMYLDRFGYVRAYALAQGSQYALLTELYPTNSQNYNFVNNRRYIAEVQIGDAEVTEYNIANMSGKLYTGSIFNSESAWTQRINRYYNNEYNFLQPAIAHLGNPANTPGYRPGNTQGTTAVWKDVLWNRGVMQTMWNDDGYLSVFTYGVDYSYTTDNGQTEWDVGRFSYTNIADYRLDGEDITLNSASQLQKDAKGEQVYYHKDYLGRSDYRYTRSTWVDTTFEALPEAQQTSANKTALGRYFDAQVDGTAYSYTGKAEDGSLTLTNVAGTINFYPVYKVDYVQLAAQDVKGGTIHYDIDKDYGTRYNTLGNGYVDATVDTEFYIVTPNGITYKTGYADLPTVKKGEIRAAYAVATNTQNAANGYDYWVADVIVIETNGLSGTWDSVSAMYYNPFEKTGSVRYINSLNAAWKTWQPDSDDLAMLDVVPGAVYNSEGDLNDNAGDWGNHPWKNEYGFYALYNTDLDDAGDLNAQRVVHIQEKWNDYGIYAGTVQRIRSLTGSGYIDVDKQGRPAGSLQVMTAADTLGFYFDGVPVYRVADKSATEIVLNQTSYSDVKIGDPIVWVYEKGSTSKVAFVIDLKDNTPKSEYVVPTWLQNDYDAIVRYQKNLGKSGLDVILGFDATAGESMTVEPVVKTDAGNGVASVKNNVASLAIPEKAARVQFVVKTSGIADLSKLVFTVDQANWRFEGVDVDGADVTVEFIRVNDLTKSLAKVIEDVTGNNAVMTYAYFQENVLDDIDTLVAAYNAETDADKKAELEEQIKAAQNILDASVTYDKTVADAIDTAMDTLTEAVDPTPAESFGALTIKTNNLGVTAEGDKVVIQHRAGNQAATLNIKQGELDELTIAQLVSCLTTDANETVTFVSAKNLDGQDTPDTTFAKRASSIVVKVGTCADLLTITVSNNAQALAYYPVTWTTGADITVTVENPGTQKDIKKGDTVANGDKFLEGVVLAVAYGPNTKTVAANADTSTYGGTWNGTAKTFTVGNKAGDLTVTAYALFAITDNSTADAVGKITFTAGVTMDGSAKKVLEGADLKFTVADGYEITALTVKSVDKKSVVLGTISNGVYTIADVDGDVAITAAAKTSFGVTVTGGDNKVDFTSGTFMDNTDRKVYSGDSIKFTLAEGYKISALTVKGVDKKDAVLATISNGTYTIAAVDGAVAITVDAQDDAEKIAAALTGKTFSAVSVLTKAEAVEAIKAAAKAELNRWLAGAGVEVKAITAPATVDFASGTSATVKVKATLKKTSDGSDVAYTALSDAGIDITVSFTNAKTDVANAINKTFKITSDKQTDADVAAAVKAEIEALTVEGAVISDVTCTAARASGVKWEVGADVTVTYGYTIKVGNLTADTVSSETIVIGLR